MRSNDLQLEASSNFKIIKLSIMARCFEPPPLLSAPFEMAELDLLIDKYWNWFGADASDEVHSGLAGGVLLAHCLGVLDDSRVPVWRERALALGKSLGTKKPKGVSFVEGRSGVLCMIGLVDAIRQADICDALCEEAKSACDADSDLPDELWYGRAGLLSALLFADEHFNNVSRAKLCEHELLLYDRILKEQEWKWHGKRYLGLVHGASGILLCLLRARAKFSDQFSRPIEPLLARARKLLAFQFESGNIRSNPKNGNDKLVQICHGAPGVALLLLELGPEFRNAALACCDCVWKRGCLTKGVGICHGIGGLKLCVFC